MRLRDPGLGIYDELAPTLDASQPHTVARCLANGTGSGGGQRYDVESENFVVGTLTSKMQGASNQWAPHNEAAHIIPVVRRLVPEEAEALQGFPRGYTLIQQRGKPAADGPRYRALGNSFAVPVVRWIGERIAAQEAEMRASLAEAA